MNNTEENLHLFTKVEDGLPLLREEVLLIAAYPADFYQTSLLSGHLGDDNIWYNFFGNPIENKITKVTHWLDLSKLTTKDAVLSALNTFKEDKVMPGCTYGDTDHPNPPVVYGKDIVIYGVKEILNL